MNAIEAIKLLSEGQRVRKVHWVNEDYIIMDVTGKIISNMGDTCFISSDLKKDEWELFNGLTSFLDIETGNFFKFQNKLYMKINEIKCYNSVYNAILVDEIKNCCYFGTAIKVQKL